MDIIVWSSMYHDILEQQNGRVIVISVQSNRFFLYICILCQ